MAARAIRPKRSRRHGRHDLPDGDASVASALAKLPNALTIARLVLIPVFVVLLLGADGGHSWPAALVFAVAGVTDQIDGWLARRWHVESSFGKVADPLADQIRRASGRG